MTLHDLGLIFFAASILVIGVVSLIRYINTYNKRRVQQLADAGEYAEAVDHLYSMIWTGLRHDEVEAWERVIWYLEEYQYGPEMITEAKLRWLCRLYHGRNVRYDEEPEASDPFQGSKHYPIHSSFEDASWILLSEKAKGKGQKEGV